MALTEQAANQLLQPAAHIHDLSVHLVGGIALATYVLLEEGSREAGMIGKRFRKTDTYVRDGASWLLVGAVEIAIPFRPSVPVVLERRRPLLGRYALGTVDSVLIALAEPGRLSMQGPIGPPDTLYAENDTTYFMDGDPGWWIFTTKSGGRSDALVFRMTGGKDVVYTRTAEP